MAPTVFSTPDQTMALVPPFAVPAPIKPPIKACELDDGIPPHHVTRFHVMAPMSAPKMTRQSTTSAEMRPVPIVWATWSPKNRKAMKLKNAAHSTAMCGDSTRVETTVAIEFAASCSPLRKSKIRARAMRAMSSASVPETMEKDTSQLKRARSRSLGSRWPHRRSDRHSPQGDRRSRFRARIP